MRWLHSWRGPSNRSRAAPRGRRSARDGDRRGQRVQPDNFCRRPDAAGGSGRAVRTPHSMAELVSVPDQGAVQTSRPSDVYPPCQGAVRSRHLDAAADDPDACIAEDGVEQVGEPPAAVPYQEGAPEKCWIDFVRRRSHFTSPRRYPQMRFHTSLSSPDGSTLRSTCCTPTSGPRARRRARRCTWHQPVLSTQAGPGPAEDRFASADGETR